MTAAQQMPCRYDAAQADAFSALPDTGDQLAALENTSSGKAISRHSLKRPDRHTSAKQGAEKQGRNRAAHNQSMAQPERVAKQKGGRIAPAALSASGLWTGS